MIFYNQIICPTHYQGAIYSLQKMKCDQIMNEMYCYRYIQLKAKGKINLIILMGN